MESKENTAPVAKISSNKTSGTVALAVAFTGSGSTDDTGVTGYSWDFKDGNGSDQSDASHTFETAGTYAVELTVTDAEGLTNTETVSITVESKNTAPVAKASADRTSGTVPLAVAFTGSGSTDDTGVTGYSWDFKDGNGSDQTDASHTFETAGTYAVELTVTDAEGLTNTSSLNINVTTAGNLPCSTGSGAADENGPKVWCWENISVPEDRFFSDHELFISSHCNPGMVTKSGNRLRFKVNPTTPSAPSDCGDYNYRAEIREHPSDVNYPSGTEQWWGFDYKFENDYKVDQQPWIFWQTHGSFSYPNFPMTNLQIGPANYGGTGGSKGELYVQNNAITTGSSKYASTGIVPRAGQTIKVVIHMVWGDENSGRYQVWNQRS
ncbi:PKD domain-containing protein [Zobellia nedashkovskayae]